MHWNSFADFVHMGGYGLFVWSAYGATLAVMLAEPWLAARRHRQAARAAAEPMEAESER